MKKTIIHMTTYLQGGAGKLICDLIEQQVSNDIEVICFSNLSGYPGYQSYKEYENKLAALKVKHFKIEGLFKRGEGLQSNAINFLSQYLSDRFVSLVHCHAAIPAFVALESRAQLNGSFPIISTMHGWGNNKTTEQTLQDLSILSRLDKVVTVSKSSYQFLQSNGLSNTHLELIYNGVSSCLHFSDPEILKAIDSHSERHIFKIACVGTVCERKNQALLVEAMHLLNLHGLKFICCFFGELNDPYAQDLIRSVEQQNLSSTIRFMGCVEHASHYLSYFNLMVLPTKAEGLPISILEAFREKTLVLSSDINECAELVSEGRSGFLFESNSSEDLASKIRYINQLSQERIRDITIEAYQLYITNFTLKLMSNQYINIYKQVQQKVT